MDKKRMQEFINAMGVIAETSLLFYRNVIKAGASVEEAVRLTQAFIAACMYGNIGQDKKPE